MQTIGKDLSSFKESVWTDDDRALALAIEDRAGTDGYFRLTLSHFDTLAVKIRTPLTLYGGFPVVALV
jgi:hypothetical protein